MNHTQQTANAKIIAELFSPPSEISEAAPLDLSQQQLQTLLHIALATITHFFGPPSRFLAGVDDPRDPSKIIYPLHCLLFTGLLMFLCHLAARRQIALKFRDNAPSAANFARLFGVEQAPGGIAGRSRIKALIRKSAEASLWSTSTLTTTIPPKSSTSSCRWPISSFN